MGKKSLFVLLTTDPFRLNLEVHLGDFHNYSESALSVFVEVSEGRKTLTMTKRGIHEQSRQVPRELYDSDLKDQRYHSELAANITGIEDRYDSSWQAVIELIGSDHPWLGKVEDVVKRWGLLAVWGPGVVVETMVDQDGRKRRSEGEDSVQMPYFEMTWNIRRIPVVDDMFPIFPPAACPGMTDEQWNQDVEEFRREGLSRLRAYRTNLPKFEVWSARYSEMEQHVEWLFRRITPPYLTPVNQAYEGLSIHTIEIGIRKTARLLGLRVSPGVRGPRKLRGLERQERKGREVPS